MEKIDASEVERPINPAENAGYTEDPKVRRKLLRKLDWHIIPPLAVLYSASQVDRGNMGSARVDGMDAALGLATGSGYSVALLVFFIGYMFLEIPSNMVLHYFRPRNWLCFLALGWSIALIGQGFVANAAGLAGCRFVLGCFEAGFWPGTVFLTSCWYRRYEVQIRIAWYFVAAITMNGFTGILSYAIGSMRGLQGLEGFRWIFIIEGAVSGALAIIAWFFIVDFPDRARFLNPVEFKMVQDRLNADRGDAEIQHFTFRVVFQHLGNWKLWFFAGIYLCAIVPNYALSYFLAVILKGFGYSVAMSQLLTAPPFLFAVIWNIVVSYFSDRHHIRAPYAIFNTLAVVVGLSMMVGSVLQGVKYAGSFLAAAGAQTNAGLLLSFLQNNIVGTTKRGVGSGLQIGAGALAGIIASTVYRQEDAPQYLPGLGTTLALAGFQTLLLIGIALIFRRENKRLDEGRRGLIENTPGFRYTL